MTTHPLLYQLNTRVMLHELAQKHQRTTTLDDLTDETLDELARLGFEWLYLLGVWQTGRAAMVFSQTNPGLREEYLRTLPDFCDDDVSGSCFAITSYTVHEGLGGEAALRRLRERMKQRGLRLMLDFVPNHTAPDHPWAQEHPEYYVRGTIDDLAREPLNYTHIASSDGKQQIFAYGRDPNFTGWADTLQLDYSNPQTQAAMQAELLRAASLCDGLRCDMAMLILPDIFQRTWGRAAAPFWPEAIGKVKAAVPDFVFMAEVYWDLESALLNLGFDYTYDKRLYDRLRDGNTQGVRDHLHADPDFLRHMVHFLENHDEQRAAALFPPDQHRAAAVAAFFTPGVRFFHNGQLEGRKTKVSVHLGRGPEESADPALVEFYGDLLAALREPAFHQGRWSLLNASSESILAYAWQHGAEQRVIIVNYAPRPTESIVHAPNGEIRIELPAWGFRII